MQNSKKKKEAQEEMKVCYIAGPYRAASPYLVEQNIREAEALALQIWQRGHVAVCVHSMARYWTGAAPIETWLEGDIELMSRCDCVLLVPGWEHSSGTLAEIEWCKLNSMPVFYELEDALMFMEGLEAG